MYGRACTIFPRTLEFLDQLDLLDEFTQMGLIGRTSVNYKNGKQVNGRGWQQVLSKMNGTYLDFCVNLRLKYSERIIQDAYEKIGGKVVVGWELRNLSVDSASTDGYKVSAIVGAVGSDEVRTLKRYDRVRSLRHKCLIHNPVNTSLVLMVETQHCGGWLALSSPLIRQCSDG